MNKPRIFFYANILTYDSSVGITKKVFSQITTLREMGYEVYYSGYTSNGVAVFDGADKIVYSKDYSKMNKKFYRLARRWKLINLVINYVIESKANFNYAYLRFHYFDATYLKMLKIFKHVNTTTIVEAHGFPYRDKKLSKLTPIFILDKVYEQSCSKQIDLVAAISNRENIWNCKTIQIDNAINLDELPLQVKHKKNNRKIRLISVSNEQDYHGYPKLVNGLSKYYLNKGNEDIEIIFVGEFKTKTQKLVQELGLEDHIRFVGKKYGQDLIDLYNTADLGIGALGYHRGSEYGSSIKTKEYFALGLPFINGWREYAFNDDYPYVLRFELSENIINFEKVVAFYSEISKMSNVQVEMRKFAEEHYTWESQFKKIFSSL